MQAADGSRIRWIWIGTLVVVLAAAAWAGWTALGIAEQGPDGPGTDETNDRGP